MGSKGSDLSSREGESIIRTQCDVVIVCVVKRSKKCRGIRQHQAVNGIDFRVRVRLCKVASTAFDILGGVALSIVIDLSSG